MSEDPWLVVGLGNPGDRYAGNRHNVGFMVLDAVAARLGERFGSHRSRAAVVQTRLSPVAGRPGPRLVLAKPSVYMNESGGPVAGLASFFGVPTERLLVVHDELDLPLGTVRLKRGGGEGGHNGLRSISRSLGAKDYARLRLGVGRPPGRQDPADFVLRDFASAERVERDLMVGDADDAVDVVLTRDFVLAQTEINAPR